MSHAIAPLTPEGCRRYVTVSTRAVRSGISLRRPGFPGRRWVSSTLAGRSPGRLVCTIGPRRRDGTRTRPEPRWDRVEAARRQYKVDPVHLAARLRDDHGMEVPVATVYAILRRRGISRLADLDVTGEDLREPAHRYELGRHGRSAMAAARRTGPTHQTNRRQPVSTASP